MSSARYIKSKKLIR